MIDVTKSGTFSGILGLFMVYALLQKFNEMESLVLIMYDDFATTDIQGKSNNLS